MDRPQYEKKAFTSASVIPDLPAKKDLLKEPVKAEFDREMAVQDEVIQKKRDTKDAMIKKRRAVREGGMAAGGGSTKKGELTDKINVAKTIRSAKRTQ
jgi:hypothetical protein